MLCWGAVVFGLIVGAKATTLNQLEQKVKDLEKRVHTTEQQLEHGGKHFQAVPLSVVQLRDHDYIKLQFLGARDAWLGCSDICGLRTCPNNGNYRYFDSRCSDEEFQIIGDGSIHYPIKSGQRIRIRYLYGHNTWMGCSTSGTHCTGKATCPGTTAQGMDFTNDRCWGEIFSIYARGRKNGDIINNGDVVMLYYRIRGLFVSIQGESLSSKTSLNFCPGLVPPAYLSYSICSKNAFRIYRKP